MTYLKLKRTGLLIAGCMLTLIILGKSLIVPVVGQGSTDPPDETTLRQSGTLNGVPGGPGFVTESASAFRPRSSSTQFSTFWGGPQLTTISGDGIYVAPVLLPHGATITKFILYYRDNAPSSNLIAELARARLPGNLDQIIAGVFPDGSSAVATYTENTSIANPVVDLQQYAYYIRLRLPADPDLEVNGFRIDYEFVVALPVIKK